MLAQAMESHSQIIERALFSGTVAQFTRQGECEHRVLNDSGVVSLREVDSADRGERAPFTRAVPCPTVQEQRPTE